MRPFSTVNAVVITGLRALVHPGAAPRREILGRPSSSSAIRSDHDRVAEREAAQVVAQPVAERVGADERLELAHDDRRLVVDDVAVQRAGLVQVRQRLADRRSCLPCDRRRTPAGSRRTESAGRG